MPDAPQLEVERVGNRVLVNGVLGQDSLQRIIYAINYAARSHDELELDFSGCNAAFASTMLAVCAQAGALRERKIAIALTPPADSRLNRLFLNSNWAYLIDPLRFRPSTFRGHTHVPATPFATPTEQQFAVDSILGVILGAVGGMERGDFAAIEWALNEITDNVLVHARTGLGGLVQVTTFERARRRIEFVVCDAGASIPATLRETHNAFTSDAEALERAVREGITRDPSLGQGNGLFGTYEVCRVSGGYFRIYSRNASLDYDDRRGGRGLRVNSEQIPYQGTLIVACVDCSRPGILQDALKFGGKQHVPTDMIETRYEADEETLHFSLRTETLSVGSRLAGEPVRIKLRNLADMCRGKRVFIDCAGIPLLSSSFADEVFGKLFVEMGPLAFSTTFQFVGMSETVRSLLDRAIAQRMAATR